MLNGSYDAPYTNPKGPVHIVTGSAVSFLQVTVFAYVFRVAGSAMILSVINLNGLHSLVQIMATQG